MSTDLVIVGVSLVALLEPLRAATVKDLFSQPHETDEGTEGARDNKTTLETVCQQVVSATQQNNPGNSLSTSCLCNTTKQPWKQSVNKLSLQHINHTSFVNPKL